MKRAKTRQALAPTRLFRDQEAWAAWLERTHRSSSGIWLRLAKKGSGLRSVAYGEALETALCYGWIDGQKRPENDCTWLQKFVPRSGKSLWSKINRDQALALMKEKRMKPAGFESVERAKANGRWDAAYDSPSRSAVPRDLAAALDLNPRAQDFFETLDRANRYAILFRIQNVRRGEMRARKIQQFVAMLARHEKIHP
jgi:uncharacterized protein YdeI (YjbR/CyaY-like superfamily)